MDHEAAREAASSVGSPRAATAAARVYRGAGKPPPRERWLRLLALLGTLLIHFAFLLGVVLGPAYEPLPPPSHEGDAPLVVRLLDRPEPPPPPAVRGAPPRERGPNHHGGVAGAIRRPSLRALPALPAAALPPPVVTPPPMALASVPAPTRPHAAAAPAAKSLPAHAPDQPLNPVPLVAAPPPAIDLRTPPTIRPTPPRFQPEPVRKAQLEGNQPMPPPASLALQPIDAPPPTQQLPQIAMDLPAAPHMATVAAVAPPLPAVAADEGEPSSLPAPPAQTAPRVELQPVASAPPSAPQVAVELQRPVAAAPEPPPVAPAEPSPSPPRIEPPPPSPQVVTTAPESAIQPVPAMPLAALTPLDVARPAQLQAPAPDQPIPAASPPARAAVDAPEQAAARLGDSAPGQDAATVATGNPGDRPSQGTQASASGQDDATPGLAEGMAEQGTGTTHSAGAAAGRGDRSAGQHAEGEARDGAATGAANGVSAPASGSYVQLQPHGDTQIMQHRGAQIGYKPTRFEQDWTPMGESSVDTALRRTAEKLTVRHTFNLPRGVRVECMVAPLFPMMVLGCRNPDPPAKAADQQLYTRLNLGSANPLAPAPAGSVAVLAPIVIDHAAECAAARVSGGPLPPGCAAASRPPPVGSVSAQGSWVPASDQFH